MATTKAATKKATAKTAKPRAKAPGGVASSAPAAPPAPLVEPDHFKPWTHPIERDPARRPGGGRKPATEETILDQVKRQHGEILAAYMMGASMDEAGELCEPRLRGASIRVALFSDVELHKRYLAAKEQRAHYMIETAGSMGVQLAQSILTGKDGADLLLKVAAKTAPKLYGDKQQIELTGSDGGPIESKVELSPSDAYRKMLGQA